MAFRRARCSNRLWEVRRFRPSRQTARRCPYHNKHFHPWVAQPRVPAARTRRKKRRPDRENEKFSTVRFSPGEQGERTAKEAEPCVSVSLEYLSPPRACACNHRQEAFRPQCTG